MKIKKTKTCKKEKKYSKICKILLKTKLESTHR